MVLHELLVGRRYFPANMEKTEIQDSLLNQGILPPVTFREEIPTVLNDIVRRSTSKDPGERFSSIFEMENALRDFIIKDVIHRKQVLHPAEEILQLVRMVQAHKANKADKKLKPFCRTLNSSSNVGTALAFANPPESEPNLATRILRFLRQRLSLT